MSTVAEIETALEQLPTQQMLAVAAWLDERRAMLSASETISISSTKPKPGTPADNGSGTELADV